MSGKNAATFALKLFALLVCIIALFPVILIVIYSFTAPGEIARYFSALGNKAGQEYVEFKIVPQILSLTQYYNVLIGNQMYLKYFLNSVNYSFAIAAGQLLIAPVAAYAFSCFRFKFRDALFFAYIVIMMLPFQAYMIANYLALNSAGLIGSGWALILPGIFSPFAVFLLRQYMVNIPKEVLEASQIDGADSFRRFIYIVLPFSAPGLAAMIVLSFAESWNMIEQPLLFLKDSMKYPLSLALQSMSEQALRETFAGAALFITPVILLFLIFQQDVVKGIESFKFNNSNR